MTKKYRQVPGLALLLVGLLAGTARAQFRASIQGVVTDPQGAVIPGASVTLIDTDNNQKMASTTNSSGAFNFNALAPDHFTVAATAKGFKSKTVTNFTLVPEQANTVNFQLQLGGETDAVTVDANTLPLLETQTASISGTVTSNQIQHMPSFGRDVTQLTQLAPGSISDGSQEAGGGANNLPGTNQGGSQKSDGIFKTENGPQIVANGSQSNANGITIDGISTASAVWGGTTVITPTEDSVGDVKVVTNNYDAEYGRFSGAQIIITSKSGSNQYHGSLFFTAQRPGLNAYQRYNGPTSVATTGTPTDRGLNRNESRFNQFGGSVSGPIIKDKLFAFFAYETLRNNGQTTAQAWYETPKFDGMAPAGSLASQFLSYPGMGVSGTLINSATCASVGLTEGPNCRTIQGQGLDLGSPLKTALGMHDPSWTGSGQPGVGSGLDGIADIGFYNTTNPTAINDAQYNGRLDANVTQKDRLNFTIYWVPAVTDDYNGPVRAANLWHHEQVNDAFSAIWNHTFSPTLINEARVNAAGWRYNEVTSNPKAPFGLPTAQFGINGTQLGNGINMNSFGPPGPGVANQWTYGYQDILTKVAGRHTIKAGGSLTRLYYLSENASAARPVFTFTNIWDFLNDAPYQENGTFNPTTGNFAINRQDDRENLYGFFVQDDFNVSSKLTVNLGLRYNYFGPLSSKEGNQSVVHLGAGTAALTGLSLTEGSNVYKAQKGNFGPQVGFAWNPSSKIVFRGGFGLSYNQNEIAIMSSGTGNVPNILNENFCCSSAAAPASGVVYALSSSPTSITGYPANPNAITGFGANNLPLNTSVSVTAFDPTVKTEYSYHYSLDTQVDLGHNFIASIGYQGSNSRHLLLQYDYNAVAAASGIPLNPAVTHVDTYSNFGTANNNSLIADLKHNFAHSFQIEATYTWAKSMDEGSQPFYEDPYPYNPHLAYGRSDYDVQNAFKVFGLWQPTFFHGNGLTHKLVDGWTLTGIFNDHTGFPWTPTYNVTGGTLYFQNSGYSTLRPAAYLGGAGHDHSNAAFESGPIGADQTTNNANYSRGALAYFSAPQPSATQLVSGSQSATAEALPPPTPGVARNFLTGPGYRDVDASISKAFGIPKLPVLGQDAKIEFRVDAFNLFNEVNLNGSSVNTTVTTDGVTSNPSFGQVANALGSRMVDIQARFSF